MKHINIVEFGCENFCCYVDEMVVEISIENPKLTVITGPNGCIIGETEIDIPRNLSNSTSGIKVKDLVGKEFYVYSYNIEKNKIELKLAKDVRKTGEKKEVWKLTYSGEPRKGFKTYDHIIATPDHLILKSDGTYVELKDLKIGDSIQSLYRRSYDGYSHIRMTTTEEYYEHKFISTEINGDSEVCHHKDHDKFNNEIENLQPMTISEHMSYHAKYNLDNNDFMWKEHPRVMFGKKHTEESKNKISTNSWKNIDKEKHKINTKLALNKKYNEELYRNKEFLYKEYVECGKTAVEIAKELGCSSTVIYNYMEQFGIERRNNHNVVGVEFYGYDDVYNMEVEDNQNYVANGIIIHNCGKTTMFDTIPFTWYGITSKGLKAEDAINNKIKKNCHTWTKLWIDDDYYEVHRYYKDSKLGSTAHIFKNKAKKPYKKGHREVKEEIENLVMPQKLFMNVLFFGQKVKSFFTDLGDADQKEIFRKILSLDEYVELYERTKKLLKDAVDSYTTIDKEVALNTGLLQSSISGIEEQNELEKKFYEALKLKITETEELITEKQSLLKEDQDKFDKEFGDIDLADVLDQLNKREADLKSKESNIDSELRTIYSEIDAKKSSKENEVKQKVFEKKKEIEKEKDIKMKAIENNDEVSNLTKQISDIDTQRADLSHQISTSNRIISTYRTEMEKFESAINDNESYKCPTCDQIVGADKVQEFQQHINETKSKIDEEQLKVTNLTNELMELSESKKKLDSELQELAVHISESMSIINDEYENQITELENRLEKALLTIDEMAKQQKIIASEEKKKHKSVLETEISKVETALSQCKRRINVYNTMFDNIRSHNTSISVLESTLKSHKESTFDVTTRETLKAKKKECEKKIKNMQEEHRKTGVVIEALEFWKDGFSSKGIPSMMIDEAIPFMNERIREYLDKIDGGRYVVSFDTMQATKAGEFRDKINVMVLDTETLSDKREKFSGGQTRIVDIATILTLCDLQSTVQNVKFNILLFDEIFDSLDDSNIGYVSNILRSISKERSIFLISHRHIDQIEADEVMSFS